MSGKPVSGTKEWSASSVNIQRGCSHNCLYCYAAANAFRFGQVEKGEWDQEVLLEKALAKNYGKRQGTIMFPTTHDITPTNLPHAIAVLKKMLESGNKVLIVSKPHLECVEAMCRELEPYKDQILFRFTIGSASEQLLGLWEPGAPSFRERFESLKHAHAAGFDTSVSMEPLLEPEEEDIEQLIRWLDPFVTDSIWLGKANRLVERIKRNGQWNDVIERLVTALLASQTDERILRLYGLLRDHPKVKWKESIKAVVGIDRPTEAGLDQ